MLRSWFLQVARGSIHTPMAGATVDLPDDRPPEPFVSAGLRKSALARGLSRRDGSVSCLCSVEVDEVVGGGGDVTFSVALPL
jgi:hypothetical protein